MLHTYHSRFIPEGVAETSQIFLRDTHILSKLLATRNTADVTGGKTIAILSQSISGVSDVNPLVEFYDIHERKGEVLFFCSVLAAHETQHTQHDKKHVVPTPLSGVRVGERNRILDMK
jgi:hypothetical protein